MKGVRQVEGRGIQAEKQDGENLDPESYIVSIEVRHSDERKNSGSQVDGKARQRPRNQPVHGGYRELLCKSEHSQIESANGADDHHEANEMHGHQERPPKFIRGHQVCKLAR